MGCSACVDICSAEAISSDKARQRVVVNPNLCVGCGACTTVCPRARDDYAYPPAAEQGNVLKPCCPPMPQRAARTPMLLLHSQGARRWSMSWAAQRS